MAPANSVLLPKVFPSNSVALGQLVRSPLSPSVNSYWRSSTIVVSSDISSAPPEKPFNTIVSTDVRGRFSVGLTKLLGLNIGGENASLLSIKAESLTQTGLKDARAVFARICADEQCREFINEMVLNKAPCFLVVGIQELQKAVFKRVVLREGGAGGHATIPLEQTGQLPIHLKGDISAESFGMSTGTVSGVFGIEVQKLRSKIVSSGAPVLNGDVSWHWSYQRVKGQQKEENKEIHIGLEQAQLDELLKLLAQDDEDEEDEEDE